MNALLEKLQERAQKGNLRALSLSSGMIDLFSNDYLGMARSQELADRINKKFQKYNGKINGSAGSRLLAGNNPFFIELEAKLARLFNAEAALIFNSGYNANLAILSSVASKGDTIIYDERIHASLKDGARLSYAKRFSFAHNDLDDLEKKLKKAEGNVFVVLESVYSMDGDICPLDHLLKVTERYDANVILDEAHSTGVMGDGGNGFACTYGLQHRLFARVHTFGKAMGVHGACIVGSKLLIDYLINFARPFIYTTALPLHSIIAIEQAFDHLARNMMLQSELRLRIRHFEKEVNADKELRNICGKVNDSPIQVLLVPGNDNVRFLARVLQEQKLDVRAILCPTVKEGEERLRICLHAFNHLTDISKLMTGMKTGIGMISRSESTL